METYDIGLDTTEEAYSNVRTDYLPSIIAGKGKTSKPLGDYICGIAPSSQLISIKVCREKDTREGADNIYLAKGINTAVEKNTDIICIGVTANTYSPEVEAAILNAYQAGVAVFRTARTFRRNARKICMYQSWIPLP